MSFKLGHSNCFFHLSLKVQIQHNLPPKEKTNVCTIMYTSGTTGEPKGVILSNGALMAEVFSVDQMLLLTDKVVCCLLLDTSLCLSSNPDSRAPFSAIQVYRDNFLCHR